MATENGKTKKENEARVAEEYLSSLADLNCNSKPLINMLTILAEENMDYAPVIVRVVEQHIHKVPPEMKLPILYLIDSIVKNVPGPYVQLFSQCIVNIFCGVFEKVNEKIRERMYALRQTWNEVFSVQKLYTLDVKVKNIDNNWPITAKIPQPSIHVNPNFLNKGVPSEMEEILHAKTRELLELKKRKLELELEATKKHLEEQEKQLAIGATPNVEAPKVVQNVQPTAFPPNLRNMPQQNQFPLPVDNKLNTVRHRDPRLMKQQLQQQQKQQQQQQQQLQQNANSQLRNNAERRRSPNRTTTTITIDENEHARRRKGRSTSNSPAHSSSYSARSSSSSSSRFRSKNSSEKSSSKSSSDKRSSSSSKKSSSERHAKSKPGDSSPSSNSSGISPSKHKDSSKRKSKSSSKTRSRSNSPSEERKQNDLEKRHLPSNTTSTTTDVVNEQGKLSALAKNTKDLEKTVPALLQQQQQPVSGAFSKSIKDAISSLAQSDNEVEINSLLTDEGKRKSSNNVTDDEPLIKRSKALNGSNNDKQNLFGESDMEIDEECAPSPPVISKDTDEWSKKRSPSSPKNASLDSVRAKLLKATKYSKVGKFEKNNRDLSHRLKLADLHTNEDSQEANDEKIRTILTQAQEMLDTKSINSEQYRTLLQTVMSINESNKLKEAKKRESLLQTNAEDEFEKERTAAREAVLKKRIPKLTKVNNKTTSPLTTIVVDSPSNSPLYEDNNNAEGNDENDHRTQRQRVSRDNKRTKPSKWGERVEVPNHMPQRNWLNHNNNNNNNNNIVRPGFRPNMPGNGLANNNLRLPQFAGFNNNHGLMRGNSSVPPPPQPPMALRLPMAASAASSALPSNTIAKPCNSIDNPQVDLVRTITVDGQSKEIRIYGAVAIVFMELDQPREIGFKPGQRAIVIDNGEPVVLQFNDVYKPVNVAGVIHQMRFGFPSRELYIDENWYEIYFGGMPVSIPIAGKRHILKAEGPPPQVHIGPLRRDLVVGKINMIVDAHIVIPLFLDAHLQTFQLGEQQHTIQFADNLLSVLLDGELAKVEYGGLPKSYKLGDGKYFIRFTALPQGVVAGKVQIKDMVYVDTEPATEAATVATPAALESMKMEVAPSEPAAAVAPPTVSALNNLNIDELFQKLVSSGILGATSSIPVGEAKVEKEDAQDKAEAQPETGKTEVEDMSEHFAITPINLRVPESIKTRQQGIVNMLFHGMQCSSCGVRFPPEQTIKYSQHLDWHFRQNRRERDAARKAHARKWFYNLADWLQYKEIEDIEEREKNYFESQQHEDADEDDTISNQRAHSPEPTCAAGPDDVDRACDMCHEKFEQFYNEELEEWHLRCAIRIEDKYYHPLCYEDYKASLVPIKDKKDEEDTTLANANDDNAMDIDMKTELKPKIEIPMETAVIDDDDDDVIVLPNEEPVITELDDDDDEYVPSNVTREQMGDITLDEAVKANNVSTESTTESDADIEIQEPNIPFTDLDTYVEKELTSDEISKQAFMNVKIKEEPKDDDEDDGFEEVGTVLISADEEITINSEDTIHSPMINTKDSEAPETPEVIDESSTIEGTLEEGNNSNSVDIDGNQANEDKLNLSSTGGVNPAPVIPLASLVNKIKINITKNINTTNSTNSNITTTTTTTTNTTTGESISSIPVLYGGAAVTTSANHNQSMNFVGDLDTAHGIDGNIVNNIRVIGAAAPSAPASVLPIEDTITYELKPLLKNVPLKKVKKIEAGVETSGLCSIM